MPSTALYSKSHEGDNSVDASRTQEVYGMMGVSQETLPADDTCADTNAMDMGSSVYSPVDAVPCSCQPCACYQMDLPAVHQALPGSEKETLLNELMDKTVHHGSPPATSCPIPVHPDSIPTDDGCAEAAVSNSENPNQLQDPSCDISLKVPHGSKMNLSDTNSAVIPICRICHMPEEEEELLISPCRCAGTMQWIHNGCLMKWLEIKAKKSKKSPRCELCRYQYHRHKKFKFDHWRFPRVSKQDKILHIIFIINLMIMIACAIATIMCFLSDKGKITKFPRNKVDLSTEEIITLSCGVLFFVSFFIAMSVQIKAKHTIYQLFVKFIMQNMEWEIDEYDKSKDSLYAEYDGPPSCV